MPNGLSVGEAFDQVFRGFAAKANAAALETRSIYTQGPTGIVVSHLQSVFIPTASPDDGVLVSRVKNQSAATTVTQVQGGICYTHIGRFYRAKEPGGWDALFVCHLNPPGPNAAILDVAGWAYHLTIEGKHERVEAHVLERGQTEINAPSGVVVVDEKLNLDPRFATMSILARAMYAPAVVRHLGELIYADLAQLPAYDL